MRLISLILVGLLPLASSFSLKPSTAVVVPSDRSVKKSSLFFSSAAMGDTDDQKKDEWTKPRVHNTAAFRSIAILGAITAAGLSSNSPLSLLSAQAKASLHLFSYATWFGTMGYTTFILGITMFKNLPRKTFGKLQAKLFPKYFALSSIAIVLQVRRSALRVVCSVRFLNLGVSLMRSLSSLTYSLSL